MTCSDLFTQEPDDVLFKRKLQTKLPVLEETMSVSMKTCKNMKRVKAKEQNQ